MNTTTRILRHALSVLLLPFVVVVVVPSWITAAFAALDTRWASDAGAMMFARLAAVLLFASGVALFAWCVRLFAAVGDGTLAPWDPTRRLVAVGPYRHLRNPMISGVAAMLGGEALFLGSRVLASWFAAFVLINHLYFLLSEEPGLERRFGQAYLEYKATVPRWIPGRAVWRGRES